jgi:hypothetical protein
VTDIVWWIVGFGLGYIIALGTRARDIPEELETCDSERLQLHEDIVYYKRLTKNLVDENKELRKQINDA